MRIGAGKVADQGALRAALAVEHQRRMGYVHMVPSAPGGREQGGKAVAFDDGDHALAIGFRKIRRDIQDGRLIGRPIKKRAAAARWEI